ncbi:MAG: membrane protein insertion efficiency factor YidD [Enterococcus sp.]|nr:membrane protein insertion efficiency factor YidD [Enterococcus sp.]
MKTLNKIAKNCLKAVAIFIIRFYQWVISPHTVPSCRHIPTCSQYGVEAIQKFGLIKGGKLTVKRLSRCRPGGTFGYDPVPSTWEDVK